jgi:hypothetical protein
VTQWPAAYRMAVAGTYWPAGCQSLPGGQLIPDAMVQRWRAVRPRVPDVMTSGDMARRLLIVDGLRLRGLCCH